MSDLHEMKIGVIGAGSMGRALISGLLRSKKAQPQNIIASTRQKEKTLALGKDFGIRATQSNEEVCKGADILIIALKPQILGREFAKLKDKIHKNHLVISIAAGVSLENLSKALPKKPRLIRVMPNIASLVDEGVSAISASSNASEKDTEFAESIFQAVGKTLFLDEELMDAVTGLSGSGPAYVFMIVDALADAGVKMGLSRENSLLLSCQTVMGAAKLLLETGEHPGSLKDRVTSPGGTAIAGIHTLEAGGLRTTLINAVEDATIRSKELGETLTQS